MLAEDQETAKQIAEDYPEILQECMSVILKNFNENLDNNAS